MNKNLNILIVDDHPMLVDGYCLIFNNLMDGYSFNIYCAYNCEEAYKIINQNSKLKNEIDIALIDVSLPPYKEEKILCGGDLAKVFKEKYPLSKVIMITMHHEGMIIDKIITKVDPRGFII